MGGMTRLKGMGMFMAATWLGPALIMPIWSWVWKYMFEGRHVRHESRMMVTKDRGMESKELLFNEYRI